MSVLKDKMMEYFFENFKENSLIISKDAPEAALLHKAQSVILSEPGVLSDTYFFRPYLTTTQNQRYLAKAVPAKAKDACVILGAGDTLFQLLSQGILDITAIERNDLQILSYLLRASALDSLSNNEFEDFLLDFTGNKFLSEELFLKVKDHFGEKFGTEKEFWSKFLALNPVEDIKEYYIKGGLEQSDLYAARYALPYLSKKSKYYDVREKLKQAKIKIELSDAFDYLLNCTRQFDYIDITNILLLSFQLDYESDPAKFKDCVKKIRFIYDNCLRTGGTFVMDYMFGVTVRDLKSDDIKIPIDNPKDSLEHMVYDYTVENVKHAKFVNASIFEALSEEFDLETFEVQSTPTPATFMSGPSDTVVLSHKLK